MGTSFKEFLTEEPKSRSPKQKEAEDAYASQVNTLFERIKKPCSEIIKIYKETAKHQNTNVQEYSYLWRGIQKKAVTMFDVPIRQDRQPMELNPAMHRVVNEVSSELGFPAHRGNSLFTTTTKVLAHDWGNPYIVFPVNGFEYTWFANQKDSYMFHIWNNIAFDTYQDNKDSHPNWKSFRDVAQYNDYEELLKPEVEKVFKKMAPRKSGLASLLKQYGSDGINSFGKPFDVLVTGQSFYAVQVKYGQFEMNIVNRLFMEHFG